MTERIVFLGTAGTREAVAKQLKASGGIVIQTGSNQFVINPGPGATARAKEFGINLRETTSIIVTNNTIANANDVNAVIDAITYAGADVKSVLLCSESVVNPINNQEPTLKKHCMQLLERVITLEPGKKVGINEVEVHATKTKNEEDPLTFGLKIYTPKYTIAYTGDTQYFIGLEEQYEDADILILNIAEPMNEDPGKGMSSDDAIRIIKKIKPTLVIITGFGAKMVKADPLFQAREIQKATQCQIMAAKDGLAISPVGVKSKAKSQKKAEEKKQKEEPDIEVEDEDESDRLEEEREGIKEINLDEEPKE